MPNQFNNIKIIGAGMPCTGTMSLKAALEKLGYNRCYHLVDLMQNPSQVDSWLRISRGEKVDWDQLFDGYQAIVDIPGQRYYQALMQAYPTAKVILTTCDPSHWYESLKRNLYQTRTLSEVEKHWWWLHYPLSPLRKNKVLLGGFIGRMLWDDYFEQRFEDKDFVIRVYEKHLESVKKSVPADQLLIFDVADSWQPLCDFLQAPCPGHAVFPHVDDHEHFQRFRQSTDLAVTTLAQQVQRQGIESPDKTSLIFADVSLTYAELYDQSEQIARILRHLGLVVGDRVALYLPNCIEFVTSYLGIHLAGGVVITVNTALTETEIDHILTDSQAAWVITSTKLQQQINTAKHPELKQTLLVDGADNQPDSLVSHLNELPTEPFRATPLSADDPAVLLYSSGTTGKPKGAVLSHGNLQATARSVAQALALDADDRVLIFLPLFHSYALATILGPALHSGAGIVILPEFEANQLLQTVRQHQVTTFFAVPTIYTLLQEQAQPEQLQSIRQYLSAGTSLPLETARQWQAKFDVPIQNGLGFTEGSYVSLNPEPLAKPGSVGLPLPGFEIRVLDEASQPCPHGELGEIVARGPNIMLGYWNQLQEATQDGWFHTGDMGCFDEDGYLYVVDRRKDMVNVGGEKVYPNEVEQVLYRHSAVAEAAIYGVPHAMMGEEVKASIVLKKGQSATQEEVINFCRQQLAHFKLPGSVEFVDSLPRSRTGKVLKRVLRERFMSEDSAASEAQSGLRQQLMQTNPEERAALLKQQVKTEIRRIIGHDPDDRQSLFDAGMDSLMSIQLANRLSMSLGIQLPATLAMEYATVNKLTQHVTQLYDSNCQSVITESSYVTWDIYDWFPQSPIQQLYYDWHTAAVNKSFMNMNFIVRVRSVINKKNLQAALQMLLDRHPDLRLVYDRQHGIPMQKALREQEAFFVAKQISCTHWDEAKDKIRQASREPFDLHADAMLRVYLFSRADDDHMLLIVHHHIISDRTTAALTIDEWLMLYQAIQSDSPVPSVTVPAYFEFLEWHNGLLNSAEGEQMQAYWRQQLSGEPEPLKLPTDFPRQYPRNRHYGAAYRVEIDAGLTASLQQLAQHENVTLYTVMMAAYQVLLHVLTGQRDILVDTSMINRTQERFEKTIGQLSIMHTIRTRIFAEATFSKLLKQVQKTLWDALKHQGYPSRLLTESLQLPQGFVHNRPGQVLFNLVAENSQLFLGQLRQYGLALQSTDIIPAGSAGTFHEINTQFLQKGEKLIGHINYETDLYRQSTIQTLMDRYKVILRQVTTNPDQTIAVLRHDL